MARNRRDDYRYGRDFTMEQQRYNPRFQQDWDEERFSDVGGMEGQYPRERWELHDQDRYSEWNQGRKNEHSWFQRIRDEFNELRNDFNAFIGRRPTQDHNINRRNLNQDFNRDLNRNFQDNPQLRYGDHRGERLGHMSRFGDVGMRGQFDQNLGPMGQGYGMHRDYNLGQDYRMSQGYGMNQGYGMSQGYGMNQGFGMHSGYQDPNRDPQNLSQNLKTNRGPKGFQRSDDRIKEDICERLVQNINTDLGEIELKVQNGDVVLTGTVQDKHLKRVIEDIVESVLGVKDVNNQLRISRTLGTSQTESTQQSGVSGTSSVQRTNQPRTRNDAE